MEIRIYILIVRLIVNASFSKHKYSAEQTEKQTNKRNDYNKMMMVIKFPSEQRKLFST